jgi:L-Ala-D/L-Glu epimerase
MLDESIYGDADIERAAGIGGIAALKLKMSKSGGPDHLARQVARCRELGLKVVIGNGVASDLGCLHEGRLYLRLGLTTAGEMNGFLKPVHGILSAPLEQRGASLLIPPSVATPVDAKRLADFTKETVSAG